MCHIITSRSFDYILGVTFILLMVMAAHYHFINAVKLRQLYSEEHSGCSCCFVVLFHECHSSAGHPGLVISIYSIFLDRNLLINRTYLPADVWRTSLESVKI